MATLAQVRDYWDEASKNPTDADGLRPTARDPYLQSAIETVVEKNLPNGTVFDIGCGDGASTFRFAKHTKRTVGFDYVPRFVEMAKAGNYLSNAEFDVADVTRLEPVRDNSVRPTPSYPSAASSIFQLGSYRNRAWSKLLASLSPADCTF